MRSKIPVKIRYKIIIYIDDILILGNSINEHLKFVKQTLGALDNAGAKVNEDKCQWMVPEVKFIGRSLSEHKISMNQETKEKILNFEKAKSVQKL